MIVITGHKELILNSLEFTTRVVTRKYFQEILKRSLQNFLGMFPR